MESWTAARVVWCRGTQARESIAVNAKLGEVRPCDHAGSEELLATALVTYRPFAARDAGGACAR